MRHNPRMPLIRTVVALSLATLVASCDTGQPPVAAPAASTTAMAGSLTNGMEFSGERACVDCDGIESWLRLEQVGKVRRYRMVEIYYGQDHQRRFEDAGEWTAQGELLRLRSSEGGERVYAQLEDGLLQARGGVHGQLIPAVEEDLLEPSSFDSTR